jgi:thioredoxin-like negative regulator of GroEL
MAEPWKPAYRPLTPADLSGVAAVGGLLVVHFWAPWNGYDRRYTPALTPVRDHFGRRVVFRSANVDDQDLVPLIEQCQVSNVPMVAGLVGGQCVGSVVGLQPADELVTQVGAWVQKSRRPIDPRWRTADVHGLARAIAEDGALDRLPLLADALMDAGCADDAILSSCREAGPDRGAWWVVDLLHGRQ